MRTLLIGIIMYFLGVYHGADVLFDKVKSKRWFTIGDYKYICLQHYVKK